MKGVVIIALFAVAAIQLCHSAPMPDEEKKEETTALTGTPELTPPPVERTETKSEPPSADAVVPETTVKAEEKKP